MTSPLPGVEILTDCQMPLERFRIGPAVERAAVDGCGCSTCERGRRTARERAARPGLVDFSRFEPIVFPRKEPTR